MPSSSSSSSSEVLPLNSRFHHPLITPRKKDKEWSWSLISAIAITILGVLVAAFSVLCFKGIFPLALLGGELGASITFVLGAALALPGAYVTYHFWKKK